MLKIVFCLCFVAINIFGISKGVSLNNQTEVLECGENEQFNPEASPCVVHCVQRHFTTCPWPNKPACECEEKFIRRTIGGPCIAYSECRFLNAQP